MEPEKFIKDKLGEMVENPDYLKWLELQKMKGLTTSMAGATVASTETSEGGEVATKDGAAPSTMDNIKETVTDKKFLAGAGIGFLAGAATGAAITHVIHKRKKKKKKKKRGSSSSCSSSCSSSWSSSSSSDSDY